MFDRQLGLFKAWLHEHPLRMVAWGWIAISAVVLLLIGGLVTCAHAADATLTWTLPTQRTDGTAIAAGELVRTEVAYGLCSGGALPASTTIASFPAPVTTGVITGLGYGSWCFAARVVDSTGNVSALTPVVSKAYLAPPKPPTLFTVATLAYELRPYANGTFRMVQVGTVPLGAACGPALAAGFALFDGATITKATTGGAITAKCT